MFKGIIVKRIIRRNTTQITIQLDIDTPFAEYLSKKDYITKPTDSMTKFTAYDFTMWLLHNDKTFNDMRQAAERLHSMDPSISNPIWGINNAIVDLPNSIPPTENDFNLFHFLYANHKRAINFAWTHKFSLIYVISRINKLFRAITG